MEKNTKLHVVMFPWLAMGHLIPFMHLSKSIAKKGHLVSFISTPRNIERLITFPTNSINLINFVSIPFPKVNNLPHGAESSMDIPYTKAQFLKIAFDLLQPEILSFLETSTPKPDWIIYDYASHWIPNLAAKLGVSSAYFSLFTAATMAYTGPPSMALSGEDSRSTAEDFTVIPKWIPFKSNIKYYLHEVSRYAESSAGNESGTSDLIRFAASIDGCDIVVFRTCVDFEPEWFNLVCELYKKPVIPIGVLPPSFEDEDDDQVFYENWFRIKNWLDKQRESSVVYVALGTEAVLEQEQVQELAIGLEQCGLPFFWVLKSDPGSSKDVLDMLPKGFKDRIKDKSIVCNELVPQVKILSHQAIGGFLTHCGWNSVIEALSFGKVLILLPVMNDQGLNARLLQEKGVGLEIPRNVEDGTFTSLSVAETVSFVVKREEGESLRGNAREMKALFGDVEKNQCYVDNFISCLVEKRRTKYLA